MRDANLGDTIDRSTYDRSKCVASSYVAYRLTSGQADRDFRLKKLEEMLGALQYCLNAYTNFALEQTPLLAGRTIADPEHFQKQKLSHDEYQKVELSY